MNLNEQLQSMVKEWTQMQQNVWSGLLGSIQQTGQSPTPELWQKTIDTWQEAVTKTLDGQHESMRLWAGSFKDLEGAPDQMQQWAKQGQEMVERWSETQNQLWSSWFETLGKTVPATMAGTTATGGPEMLKAWQDSARKAMEGQMEWATAWAQGKAGEAGKRGGNR